LDLFASAANAACRKSFAAAAANDHISSRPKRGATIGAIFNWTPFVGGSAILASWIIVALLLRVKGEQLAEIWNKTWSQMWGACLVGVFIFGLVSLPKTPSAGVAAVPESEHDPL